MVDANRDRKRGCLLGLAVGDALGAAVEFKSPGTFTPVTHYRGGGPHGIEAGAWTDDTSMALALADSIAQCGWDLDDQARRYVAWWKEGEYSVTGSCFDIGIATRQALARFAASGDASQSGDRASQSSGNGSIMRLAPVPIRYASYLPSQTTELLRLAEQSSLPTHGSEQCLSACRYMTLVLVGLIQGADRQAVLSPDWPPLVELQAATSVHGEVAEVIAGSYRRKRPPEIKGSGYVVRSLEAALWAFYEAKDFREAVLRAVNLGDDSDTTGAVCGQFAGAFWGEHGIPETWLDRLVRKEMIEHALAGIV